MRLEFKHSVVVYVIVAIVGTVTLVLAVVGALGYQVYSREQWSDMRLELDQSANKLTAGVTLAAWNFDVNQIEAIMKSSMQDDAVLGIKIVSGNVTYSMARDNNWNIRKAHDEDFIAPDILSAMRDIMFSDQKIGQLQLYMTSRFLSVKLMQMQVYLIVTITALDLILIFILYYFAWHYVLRPLKLIQEYARSISSGDKEQAVALTQPLVGEFKQLLDSLNSMVDLLESRHLDLKKSNDRFWRMVSGFPVPLAIYSPEGGQIIYINKKFIDLFGYQHDEIANASDWFDKAYPDPVYRQQVIDTWLARVESAIRLEQPVESHTYSVTCKDGSVKTVEIGGVSSGDYIMSVLNDVTERKLAGELTKRLQHILKTHIEQAEKSTFIKNMVNEVKNDVGECTAWLKHMVSSITT